MKSSTNFSSRILTLASLALALCFLAGCMRPAKVAEPLFYPEIRVAVLPMENLTGKGKQLSELRQLLVAQLRQNDLEVIEEDALKAFMKKHRVRYTGGVDGALARALKAELGADAVIVTSLELYDEITPSIGITSRLVSTGTAVPRIDWIESVTLTGIDAPGVLGLGIVKEIGQLEKRAVKRLADSLDWYLAGEGKAAATPAAKRKFGPKLAYNASAMGAETTKTVVVVPFVNESKRKRAGELLMLQFARELAHANHTEVVDPGVVREKMLNGRMSMNKGISNLDVDMLSIPLEADFVISGRVFNYSDSSNPMDAPKSDFSALAMERYTRKVVWGSASYNKGDDAELFFRQGRILTAPALVTRMVQSVVNEMRSVKPPQAPVVAVSEPPEEPVNPLLLP